jgi:hypothetical protein
MFFRRQGDGNVVPDHQPVLAEPVVLSDKELARLEKTFAQLVEIVWDRGEAFPKTPGTWIRLFLHRGQATFFELDSWQKGLSLKTGSGEYLSPALGFDGQKLENIGDLEGDFHCYVSPERLAELLHLATRP